MSWRVDARTWRWAGTGPSRSGWGPGRLRRTVALVAVLALLGTLVGLSTDVERADADPSAQFLVTPTGFDFGAVPLGSTAPAQAATVTNVGTAPAVMSLAGGAAGAFGGQQNCQGGTLDPGQSCQISYAFTPTALGPVTDSTSGTVNGQPFAFSFAGIGTPRFLVTPTAFDFGEVAAGTTAPAQTGNVTNLGASPAVMSLAGGAAGAFGGQQNCQGTTLAQGHACQITYAFTPTTAGPVTDTTSGTVNGQPFAFAFRGVGVGNTPPSVDAGPDASGAEGSPIALAGTASDADSDPLTIGWTVTPGAGVDPGASCSFGSPASAATTVTCTDDGTFTATLSAGDGTATVTSDVTVTVTNAVPAVGVVSGPAGPVSVGTPVTVSAPFTDAGANDTHTCSVAWGDGAGTAGTVAAGACSATHTYTGPGIHTVVVTVTDDDGGAGTGVLQYVVVYDPKGGFVTGGGWIDSPPGAYTPDPAFTGHASFGFVAKYLRGVPAGSTEFTFQAADLDFRSTAYEWLVVSGPKAAFRGSGTVDGAGGYGFLLTAHDGQLNGGGGADRFRMKIWDAATGVVLYDNQNGAADDA
ncbi:MAG TPA: choice-of-anchor D domain-containing protein, partial [Acidimicrobiales bacterium]|nr:choice-of-anchor D domain-containing protein [Acidimicrobiales bacterium]